MTGRPRSGRQTFSPLYYQHRIFEVWQAEIEGQIRRFTAVEFSNCMWRFDLETYP